MASGTRTVIYAALIGNGLIAVTKFAAAAITGSSAMMSEGIHSVVDTGNQGLLLYGLHRAKRVPDRRFPFGYGKEIYFWSFVVAILIFAVGSGVSLYEGVHKVLDPHPIDRPLINYGVLGAAILFESVALGLAVREFRKVKGSRGWLEEVGRSKDPSLFVVLFEDTAAMAGLLVALAGLALAQITGNPVFDGAASIGIGLILAATAIWLAVETKSLLIGEAAEDDIVASLRRRADAMPRVTTVHEVLTMHVGPNYILACMSLDFENAATAQEIESAIATLDAEVKAAHPRVRKLFVEAESRRPGGAAAR